MIEKKKFSPVTANFSTSNHLILGYSTGNRKEIMWLLMASPLIFSLTFFNDFFSKDSARSSASGNPTDSFHPLGVALKNGSKVKKIGRKYKKRYKSFKNTSLK